MTRIWKSWYYIITKYTWNITPVFCSMTGADISNIVNQAAFQAARAGETEVNMGHLEYAKEKIRDGKSLIGIIWLVREIFKQWLFFNIKQILCLIWPYSFNTPRKVFGKVKYWFRSIDWTLKNIHFHKGSFNDYGLFLADLIFF